jgi:uncharacterized protein YicC (UPF0701 family)
MKTSALSFMDNVISGLRNAATELEEFRLQLSLGKAEASDKYEEAKNKLNEIVRDIKSKVQEGKHKADGLKAKLEELQVQLALGKAETKEIFEEQKKRILRSFHEIEYEFKKSDAATKLYSELNAEFEKFKIKLEILQLRYTLGKVEAKEEFEAKKADFLHTVDDLKNRYAKNEPDIKDNWEHFGKEINEAYAHLKKAFTKS